MMNIRFVSAHEVKWGLPHILSFAYHVDSLRSPTFTANSLLQLWK